MLCIDLISHLFYISGRINISSKETNNYLSIETKHVCTMRFFFFWKKENHVHCALQTCSQNTIAREWSHYHLASSNWACTPVWHVSTIIHFSKEKHLWPHPSRESKFAIWRYALQQSDDIVEADQTHCSNKTRLLNQPPDAIRSEFQLKTANVKRLHMIRRKQK
jgi:hypothetical protein